MCHLVSDELNFFINTDYLRCQTRSERHIFYLYQRRTEYLECQTIPNFYEIFLYLNINFSTFLRISLCVLRRLNELYQFLD